jgi:ABC-2 type transport system permease protein
MTEALRYERVRMLTVRSTWIVMALFAAAAVGLPWLFAATAPDATVGDATQIHTQLGWLLSLVIGALAIGPEYSHGTIRLALTEYPRRYRLFIAKAAVAASTIAVLGTIAWALGWAISAVLLGTAGEVGDQVELLARNLGFLIGWGLIGFATAALLRSTALGVVIPLIFALVIENLVPFLLRRPELSEWFPFNSSIELLQDEPGMWGGVAVFGAWIVGLLAVAWARFRYRDA